MELHSEDRGVDFSEGRTPDTHPRRLLVRENGWSVTLEYGYVNITKREVYSSLWVVRLTCCKDLIRYE